MKRPELVYWKGSGEVRADLLQAIRVVGYDLTTISDVDEILKRKKEELPGLVVVDASAGEAEASQRVIEMSAAGALTNTPIIFLSYQATKRSAVLKKTFLKFVPVDIPFRLQVLLERFLELCPVPTSPTVAAQETKAEDAPSAEARSDRAEAEGKKPSDPDTAAAENSKLQSAEKAKQTVPLPKRTKIKNSDPTRIKSGYGGEFFALADDLDRVDDNALLPEHPRKDQLIRVLNAMTTQDEWLGLHARRVLFLSSAIATALGLDSERDRKIRTASLYLNWGLLEKYPHYASHDILLLPQKRYVDRVGNGFRQSAIFVRENLRDLDTARTMEDVSNILLHNTHPEDPIALVDAHCVLTPELADRSSWAKLQWDPYGVHRTVRKFTAGEPFRFSVEVVEIINRALSEAASVRLLLNPIPPLLDEATGDFDAKLIADAQREAEKLFQVQKQFSLQLADLRPGMRLSRPIISWDGKLILRANVALDENLIMHLIRLSAVRPVRPPVAVLATGATSP